MPEEERGQVDGQGVAVAITTTMDEGRSDALPTQRSISGGPGHRRRERRDENGGGGDEGVASPREGRTDCSWPLSSLLLLSFCCNGRGIWELHYDDMVVRKLLRMTRDGPGVGENHVEDHRRYHGPSGCI